MTGKSRSWDWSLSTALAWKLTANPKAGAVTLAVIARGAGGALQYQAVTATRGTGANRYDFTYNNGMGGTIDMRSEFTAQAFTLLPYSAAQDAILFTGVENGIVHSSTYIDKTEGDEREAVLAHADGAITVASSDLIAFDQGLQYPYRWNSPNDPTFYHFICGVKTMHSGSGVGLDLLELEVGTMITLREQRHVSLEETVRAFRGGDISRYSQDDDGNLVIQVQHLGERVDVLEEKVSVVQTLEVSKGTHSSEVTTIYNPGSGDEVITAGLDRVTGSGGWTYDTGVYTYLKQGNVTITVPFEGRNNDNEFVIEMDRGGAGTYATVASSLIKTANETETVPLAITVFAGDKLRVRQTAGDANNVIMSHVFEPEVLKTEVVPTQLFASERGVGYQQLWGADEAPSRDFTVSAELAAEIWNRKWDTIYIYAHRNGDEANSIPPVPFPVEVQLATRSPLSNDVFVTVGDVGDHNGGMGLFIQMSGRRYRIASDNNSNGRIVGIWGVQSQPKVALPDNGQLVARVYEAGLTGRTQTDSGVFTGDIYTINQNVAGHSDNPILSYDEATGRFTVNDGYIVEVNTDLSGREADANNLTVLGIVHYTAATDSTFTYWSRGLGAENRSWVSINKVLRAGDYLEFRTGDNADVDNIAVNLVAKQLLRVS